jgi:hypothetical protein
VNNRGQNYVDHSSNEKIKSDFADCRLLSFSLNRWLVEVVGVGLYKSGLVVVDLVVVDLVLYMCG